MKTSISFPNVEAFGSYILSLNSVFGATAELTGLALYNDNSDTPSKNAPDSLLGGNTNKGFPTDYKLVTDAFEAWPDEKTFHLQVQVLRLSDKKYSGWVSVAEAVEFAFPSK